MKAKYFVGLDVHCQFTEAAVIDESGRLVRRQACPTTIPALVRLLESIDGLRSVVLEEGPLADWVSRNLAAHADQVIVCDPRRNRWIARDSDKDDTVDAEKLAQLLRGQFLRAVHHTGSLERLLFKQHVTLYHDCVRQRVRTANRICALFRRHGMFVREKSLRRAEEWEKLMARAPDHPILHQDLTMLRRTYRLAARHVKEMLRQLKQTAREQEVIRRFVGVAGIKWIRAATFFAYVDTPQRFASKQKLWKYVGVGLVRRKSGVGPARVSLVRQANRRLKYIVVGAARSAVQQGNNGFARKYHNWIGKGCSPRLAMRNTARRVATVLWTMWKNGSEYRDN